MAIKIIEEKSVPRQQIACQGCNSVLEYGNADLVEGRIYLSGSIASYKIKCPVCGVWIECEWIK